MEISYKYYISINEDNEVINFFNSSVKQPMPGDIYIQESKNRHEKLENLVDNTGKFKYKYQDGRIIEKTEDELYPLEDLKIEKVNKLRVNTEKKILKQYSLYDILYLLCNDAPSLETERNEMKAFIVATIDNSKAVEQEIKNKKAKHTLEVVKIS